MERVYSGHFEDRLLTGEDQSFHLHFDERSHGSLLIFIDEEASDVKLDLEGGKYSWTKIFVRNSSLKDCRLTIRADIEDDGRIDLGILDMEDAPLAISLEGNLNRPGATMELDTAQLCLKDQRKENRLNITSHAAHTYGTMRNYAVCYDGGQYDTVAAGRIEKGCTGSESHQQTRVLTMASHHKAFVIPILYIDENDVKASHALSIGQPDAQQLYYLQSRGLSAKQAMGLLAIGYFKPIARLIDDEAVREEIVREMESRAGLYGH